MSIHTDLPSSPSGTKNKRSAASSRTTPVPSSAGARPAASLAQVESIAKASVKLAALGPHLAELAGKMEEQVNQQARHAAEVADSMRQLADRLQQAVSRLEGASGSIQSVMGDIARIADQTRIISINASIEAARAGEMGRAFNVVAIEVQQLADQTRTSTLTIGERVQAMQGSVQQLAASVADQSSAQSAATDQTGVTVHKVNARIQDMAGTTEGQRTGAKALRSLGTEANRLTENLLFAVGTFRLQVHRRAMADIMALRQQLSAQAGQWPAMERSLLAWLGERPEFELVYVTDPHGRQMTENIGWRDTVPAKLAGARESDWSTRPWFRLAAASPGEVVVSDIYRSSATGSFCFTVSAAFPGAEGKPGGVIGADVNFQRLVEEKAAG